MVGLEGFIKLQKSDAMMNLGNVGSRPPTVIIAFTKRYSHAIRGSWRQRINAPGVCDKFVGRN